MGQNIKHLIGYNVFVWEETECRKLPNGTLFTPGWYWLDVDAVKGEMVAAHGPFGAIDLANRDASEVMSGRDAYLGTDSRVGGFLDSELPGALN